MDSQRSRRLFQIASFIYFVMLAVYFVAARFPEGRVWGLNVWAYYPDWVPLSLLVLGVVAGVLVIRHALRGTPAKVTVNEAEESGHKFVVMAVGISILMASLFWLLRGRTHFLGDGYLYLSNLGSGSEVYFSKRAIGESLIHIWMKNIIGGNNAALLSYQIISVCSGLLFLTILFLGVRALVNRNSDRLIMFLGASTGGYMLMFFGYVENYSVFMVSVLSFTIAGLLIIEGRLTRWLAVPLVLLSFTLHIFGVTLVPATIYLLMSGTRIEKAMKRFGAGTKVALLSLVVLFAVAAFTYFYTTSYYFRFNIVAIYEDRFVEGGYTILSAKHLADYGNLLIMLAPSTIILAVMLFAAPFKVLQAQSDNRYLAILTLSTLGAAFLFDPNLGMPRDWDMLSFAGIPLTLTIFYIASRLAERSGYARGACWLAIMLNLLVLGPRVVGQVDPGISLAHYTNYCQLDRTRATTAHIAIMGYYREQGDTVAANVVRQLWREKYPEAELLQLATKMRDRGQLTEAFSLARDALRRNRANVNAYNNLAGSFFALQKYDSAQAYLEIANGMRPLNPAILYSLGHLRYLEGNHREAEKLWKKSIYYDTTNSEPFLGLAALAKRRGDFEEYQRYLERAVTTEDVTGAVVKQLADRYYAQGRKASALRLYRLALMRGLPQETADELLKTYPQLVIDST